MARECPEKLAHPRSAVALCAKRMEKTLIPPPHTHTQKHEGIHRQVCRSFLVQSIVTFGNEASFLYEKDVFGEVSFIPI